MPKTKLKRCTVKTTTIKAVYINADKTGMTMEAVVCPGIIRDEKKALAYLKKRATEDHTPMKIIGLLHTETVYVMPVEEFLKHATVESAKTI